MVSIIYYLSDTMEGGRESIREEGEIREKKEWEWEESIEAREEGGNGRLEEKKKKRNPERGQA